MYNTYQASYHYQIHASTNTKTNNLIDDIMTTFY